MADDIEPLIQHCAPLQQDISLIESQFSEEEVPRFVSSVDCTERSGQDWTRT